MKLEMIIQQRKTAVFKGIRSMDAFDDRRFYLHTYQEPLFVWGRHLKVRIWNEQAGELHLEGDIAGVGDPLAFPQDDELIAMRQAPFWKRWFQ